MEKEMFTQFHSDATQPESKYQEEIFKKIKEESTLPIHIKAKGIAKKPSKCQKILLTGVTGHLGPYLLQQFSQQESLKNIFCLVRAASVEKAEERVLNKLKETSLLEKTNVGKLCYILGDVAQDRLGMDKDAYNYVANTIDAVVHNAVYSNHIKSYPISNDGKDPSKCPLRAVNVTGMKNILEFAAEGETKHVLHSSSFNFVNRIDPKDGRALEDLPEEDNLGDGIHVGYPYTKFVGEKLCRVALEQRGIPVTSIRYPMICGDSETGFMAKMDLTTLMVLSMWSCGYYPTNNFGFSLVPVDTCALIAKKLFFNDEAATGAYNLNPALPTTIEDVYEVAIQNGITPLRKTSYEEYCDRIFNDEDPNNESMKAYKHVYNKHSGLRETYHALPGLKLGWYDPAKIAGMSPKLEKYVPGYLKTIPSPQNCLQNIFDFYKNAGRLSQLGIKTARTLQSGNKLSKAAFLPLLCLVKTENLMKS